MTNDFVTSRWCDQEVGWALGRGLIVIPVRLTRDPHGFMGGIQAVPSALSAPASDAAEGIATALTTAVFRQTRPQATMLLDPLADAIITQFSRSSSFDLARRRFEFLRRIPRSLWTPERRVQLETAIDRNRYLRHAELNRGLSISEAVRAIWG